MSVSVKQHGYIIIRPSGIQHGGFLFEGGKEREQEISALRWAEDQIQKRLIALGESGETLPSIATGSITSPTLDVKAASSIDSAARSATTEEQTASGGSAPQEPETSEAKAEDNRTDARGKLSRPFRR
jgi:hypothetical protein